ncbi:unnamed protein product [Rotaria magnacalcarata]
MSSSSRHPLNLAEQQKTVYRTEDNPGIERITNCLWHGSSIIATVQNASILCVCVQPTANNQIVNQYSPSHIVNQHQHYQQQVPLPSNAPSAYVQQAMLHSNMYPQQALVSSYHPGVNTNVMLSSSMTNPNISSTPISAITKRGRNDMSGASESNGQERPQYYQTTRISNARNTPNKRHCGFNQQQKESWQQSQYNQDREEQITYDITARRNIAESTYDNQQPAMGACRYAIFRFLFSPFSIIFSQHAREKIVIDDLIKHESGNCHFELKTVAYRRDWFENNECRILIFVENSESFSFLYERNNWPKTLAGQQFTTKSPSTPPQLSLVIQAVSLKIEWENFVHELKEKYPDIADIIRLKNKAKQPVRAIKLEFLSAKKNESTCKTCGEKCANLKDHQCSGVLKCVHCGGLHISNNAKCKVVQGHRVALIRNLLSKLDSANTENSNAGLIHSGIIPSARTNHVLGEVGRVDFTLISAALSNNNVFYQSGENAHGGVLAMVRKDISAVGVSCSLPNICALDLQFDQTIRLLAVYVPESKTWNLTDLTPLVTNCCIILGDFNIDIEKDGEKADRVLKWMDSCCLGPVVLDFNASLRSDRTVDYAASIGVDLTIQAYEGDATSDYKPLLCVLARCQQNSSLNHARPPIPQNHVKLLAQNRSLLFKAKRKGDIVLRKEAHCLRNLARFELKSFQKEQLAKQLKETHLPGETSRLFWNTTKKHFRQVSSSLRGFLFPRGEIIKGSQIMVNMAADHYERLFEATVVIRPHPYTSAPPVQWENAAEPIPTVTYPEILNILRSTKKKQSLDNYGLSPFILDKIPQNYWHLLNDTASKEKCGVQTGPNDRKAVIEVHNNPSRWIKINRGGPQGSSVTPTLFITYHNNMTDFIPGVMSFFADDLAAVLDGQIGIRFKDQCIDLERRLHTLFEQLEFYAILVVQPIDYSKTQAMFSTRAVSYPNSLPQVRCGDHKVASNSTRASSISEQVEMRRQSNKNKNKLDNKTMVTDSQLKDQLVRIHSMMRTINENMPKIKDPFRAEQTGGS